MNKIQFIVELRERVHKTLLFQAFEQMMFSELVHHLVQKKRNMLPRSKVFSVTAAHIDYSKLSGPIIDILEKMFMECFNLSSVAGRRDQVVVFQLYYTGMKQFCLSSC